MLPEELERKLPDKDPIILEKNDWDQAIFRTNEKPPSKSVLDRVRLQFEPGYLIGIGSGNLLSHLPAFPNSEPRGIVSLDVSELVVSGLRVLREFLRLYPNREEFLLGIRNFLRGELPSVYPVSEALRPNFNSYFEYFANWKGDPKKRINRMGSYDPLYEPKTAFWNRLSRRTELEVDLTAGPDIQGFILQNYEIFRKLAVEGRIAAIRRDFRDEEFLGLVPSLDGYNSCNHVIYLSNAFDRQKIPDIVETIKPSGKTLIYSVVGSRWTPIMCVKEAGAMVSLSEMEVK